MVLLVIFATIILSYGLIEAFCVFMEYDSLTGAIVDLVKDRNSKTEQRAIEKIKAPEAFINGYMDMAKASGVKIITEERCYDVKHCLRTYHQVSSVKLGRDGKPYTSEEALRGVLSSDRKWKISEGQTNRQYLSGDSENFKLYYQGGMEYLADLEDVKSIVAQEKLDKLAKDRIIESRKKGLAEINAKVATDLEELKSVRGRTFSLEDFSARWNREMKMAELEGKDVK